MKMSDVFELPLRDVEDSYPLDANGVEVMSSHEEDLAAVHAINNHDELVDALEFCLNEMDSYDFAIDEVSIETGKKVKELREILKKAKS